MGGLDTHDRQNRNHADLMTRVGQALYGRFPPLGVKKSGNNNVDSSPDPLG